MLITIEDHMKQLKLFKTLIRFKNARNLVIVNLNLPCVTRIRMRAKQLLQKLIKIRFEDFRKLD